jgi:Tol biopolymer transport system component
MVQIDRDGKETLVARLDRQADTPRFSPDGKRVAFRTPAPNCDIWVRDLARGTSVRLTADGDNHGVVWHSDGTRVISSRAAAAGTDILAFSADGAGAPDVLAHLTDMPAAIPTSATPRMVLVQDRFTARNGTDVVGVPVSGGAWQPLLNGPADESSAIISPDGTLLAYVSDESGRHEIYLRPHPGQGPRTMISTSGGIEPLWSPSGEELFFRSGRDVLAVRLNPGSGSGPAAPRVLFSGDYPVGPQVANYAVYPDGRRFLMMRGRQWADQQLVVVLNWLSEIPERSR